MFDWVVFQKTLSNEVPAMAHHLSPEEREVIAWMRSTGRKQAEIHDQTAAIASLPAPPVERSRAVAASDGKSVA